MGLILMPIFLFYIAVILAATFFVVVKQEKLSKKILFSVLIPAIFFVGPVLDQIIGARYFKYLCDEYGGLTVHERVILEDEYFNDDGELKFISNASNMSHFEVNNKYVFDVNDYMFSRIWGIKKSTISVYEKEANVVAEHITFYYEGGFLARRMQKITPGGMKICHWPRAEDRKQMLRTIFIREDKEKGDRFIF